MKRIITCLASFCFLSNLEANAINNLFGKLNDNLENCRDSLSNCLLPQEEREWRKELYNTIKSAFTQLIPADEQYHWKTKDYKIAKSENGATGVWIPVWDEDDYFIECLLIDFTCTSIKNGKQYANIEEVWKSEQENEGKNKIERKKINDKEGVVEIDIENGKSKIIKKQTLKDDWVITLLYKYYPGREVLKENNWEKKRGLWLKRFQKIAF